MHLCTGRNWMKWPRQLRARVLREETVPLGVSGQAGPSFPFDPDKISVFSALHDTVAGEIRVTAEVARESDCLAMTSCTVRALTLPCRKECNPQ